MKQTSIFRMFAALIALWMGLGTAVSCASTPEEPDTPQGSITLVADGCDHAE